jgi:hypothetical protein
MRTHAYPDPDSKPCFEVNKLLGLPAADPEGPKTYSIQQQYYGIFLNWPYFSLGWFLPQNWIVMKQDPNRKSG